MIASPEPLALLTRYAKAIESEMRAVVAESAPQYAGLWGMLQYHLGWVDVHFKPTATRTGKGVRPTLCLLTAQAAGGSWEQALPAAAALELAHNFSLIHDDIEDGDRERRGRATVWALWGQAQGINAGDTLFVLARMALHRLVERGVPTGKIVAAYQVFDTACLALTQGQYLDLSFESRLDVGVEEYLTMVRGKTAALLGAACHLGALLSSDDPARVEHYRRFGEQLGIAFQIHDDILGIWGQSSITGKSSANDILRKKKTLPVLFGLTRQPALADIYAHETITPDDAARVLSLLEGAGARQFAQQMAEQHREAAIAELAKTGLENPAQDELRILARFLVERAY